MLKLATRGVRSNLLMSRSARFVSTVGTRVEHAKSCLKGADAVCFDVDSTVVTTEGIDDLAAFLGCGEKVAELTAQAMGGSMPFHEALALRLSAMQPSQQQLTEMMAKEPLQLTPGVADLISALHANKQDVYFVSGGFRQMIEPIAAQCGVGKDMIYANTFLFNEDGSFKSHLDSEPTSRAGGKAKVVADLKAKHGYKTVVMVGDGATDMEVRANTARLRSESDGFFCGCPLTRAYFAMMMRLCCAGARHPGWRGRLHRLWWHRC